MKNELKNTFFFSKSNPTPDGSELNTWSHTDSFPLDYMLIGNENGVSKGLLKMKTDLYPERVEFWLKLKANYPKHD